MTILVNMLFGSHLYGLDTPNSDKDYKGIYLPEYRDVLLQRVKKSINTTTGNSGSRNTANDIDTEMFSLQYFVELACQGQTVAIDMLHAPEHCIIESSPTWKSLVSQREKFYTSNLSAFVGYCRRQASKYGIKGSRINDAKRVLRYLDSVWLSPDTKLREVWDGLPEGEHINKLQPNPLDTSQQRIYQVVGKKFIENVGLKEVFNSLHKFVDSYGGRAELAAKNEGIDWKAVSHAIRAATQIKDIFTKGTIIFPLENSEYIKKVKLGELDYLTEVGPKLEEMIEEVEELAKKVDLPSKVDREYWDEWLYEELKYEV